MTTQNDIQVAKTILQQMGGNKFFAMTGARVQYAVKNGVVLNLRRNQSRANFLTITLQGDDTYTMKFQVATLKKNEVIHESEGVYCDMLQDIFTKVTGYDTHL